jgi:hypothetical protein
METWEILDNEGKNFREGSTQNIFLAFSRVVWQPRSQSRTEFLIGLELELDHRHAL